MELLTHTPVFDIESAEKIAAKWFDLRAKARALPSERDQNFLLSDGDGQKFVLKIANALESRSLLEAQNAVLDHLRERVSFCPKVMANVSGETISREADHYLRLVTYLPGRPLAEVKGSGPKGRITQEDVQAFVKAVMAGTQTTQAQAAKAPSAAAAGGAFPGLPAWPQVDFAKFGPIEKKELSRIKKISGPVLHRNWVVIPHVTNHDDADITELEAFRVATNKENEKSGVKVTMLAFLIKACVAALQKFPEFNASLEGDHLVLKKYFHIGFAADTPNGLVVPVIKDADRKGVLQISTEMGELAKKARDGKLSPADMSGGCFSISSLGGIGGRYFTPIINAPEVAILGVCRSLTEPVWDGKAFQPRLMLPLSLSWDHRVVDGAAAARFNAFLIQILGDFRRVLL